LILRTALLSTAVLAATLAACGGDADRPITRIFLAPPWTADETAEYNLVIEDDEIYGTCVLETRLNAEGPNTRLNRLCGDGKNRDDGSVLVEAATLKPLRANRTQVQVDEDSTERYSFSSSYEPPIVKFTADENGEPRETERDLPEPDELSPDPGYYDDESLLWLVRGIELREGYEASYQNVSAGTGQVFRVDITVEGREAVSVPAGEFTAWKVRVETSAITQFAWVDVESPHRLVQARIKGIQDVTYELTRAD
jgi:hypothetical protein